MTTEQTTLRLSRVFDASPDQVFDAWTNPETLRRWWKVQPGWECSVAEIDLAEGSRYRLGMRNPETGLELLRAGHYHEVVRPSRLTFTWTWDGPPGMMPEGETLVQVEFLADEDGTKLVLTQTGFGSKQDRDLHIQGWTGCLDALRRELSDRLLVETGA